MFFVMIHYVNPNSSEKTEWLKREMLSLYMILIRSVQDDINVMMDQT